MTPIGGTWHIDVPWSFRLYVKCRLFLRAIGISWQTDQVKVDRRDVCMYSSSRIECFNVKGHKSRQIASLRMYPYIFVSYAFALDWQIWKINIPLKLQQITALDDIMTNMINSSPKGRDFLTVYSADADANDRINYLWLAEYLENTYVDATWRCISLQRFPALFGANFLLIHKYSSTLYVIIGSTKK